MIPILLQPVCKDIVWGGNRLKKDFGMESDAPVIAEAWMLTARPDGDNLIANGPYRGKSFSEFLAENKDAVLGEKGKAYADFPLLIKLIDAKSDLSVQVHPDDAYAKEHENSYGKTEAWYVLDCDEGAQLIYGFRETIDRETFRKSIEDNTFLQYVNRVPVKKGDVFFIEAGTLHAIGGGILLAEVQQNCNTTYRVYDYGRLVNGKQRELHVEKALDVTVTAPPQSQAAVSEPPCCQGDMTTKALCRCSLFTMTDLSLNGNAKLSVPDDSFLSLLVLEGEGTVTSDGVAVEVHKGTSVFLSAGSTNVTLHGCFNSLVSTL